MHDARRRALRRIIAATALLMTVLTAAEAFEVAELTTVDARFALRGTQPAPDGVVVVAVDEQTLAAVPDPWPFGLERLAAVVDGLADAGAAVIVIDVPFGSGEQDPAVPRFHAALARAGAVVLGTARSLPDDTPAVLGGPATLAVPGVRAGDARFDPDDDGVVRRLDHTIVASDDDADEIAAEGLSPLSPGVVPALAIVAVETLQGRTLPTSVIGPEGATIDHPGPAGTVLTVSFLDVVQGTVDPTAIAGRIAVVGPTASALLDLVPTPLAERTSGTEVHAAAIGTALAGFPIRTLPLLPRLVIVLLALMLPLGLAGRSTGRAVGGTAALAVLYVALAQLAFVGGTLLPMAAVLTGYATVAVAIVATGHVFEARGGARVLAAFTRYVPASVAAEAARVDAEDDLMRAVSRDVTVLFVDLRGFTTLAESRRPDEVVEALNVFLTAMAEAVIEHGGVVTGYLGDGLMAVFGVPEPLEAHADKALAASVTMLDRMRDVGAELSRRLGGEPARIGIGLNSGPATAGNLGTPQRLEYSVVGDTVNTASRIEGLTKQSPFALLLSDSTRTRLTNPPADLVAHATVPVRGRAHPVTLWSLERTRTAT